MTAKTSANHGESLLLDASRVRFVLVEPQTAGNVGSAARALKNLGFARLVVVNPHCDPRSRAARMMAVNGSDLLDAAERHVDLDAALEGAQTVAGTSRRTGKYRKPHYRLDLFSGKLLRLAAAGELAVVFGREDSGLTDEELDRCTHLIQLPASDDYPSLNLAQSVLLVAYELRRASPGSLPAESLDPPAPHEAREAMYRHLERALLDIGFLTPDNTKAMMRRLRRLLGRAGPTAEEVQILRGVARQTTWAARQAGAVVRDDADGP